MIIYIFIIIWPVSGGLLVSFFSKLSLLEERHTQLSTHEICCENLKMDTEWKNQKTVRKKCKLHIIFYVNKRTSITPHFKLIKKNLNSKEAKWSTKFSCNNCCKISIDMQDDNIYTSIWNSIFSTGLITRYSWRKKSIKVSNVYVNSKSTCRLRVAVVVYVVCTKLCWQTYVSKAWVQTSWQVTS